MRIIFALCLSMIFVSQAYGFRFVVYGDCRVSKTEWLTVPPPPYPFRQEVLGYINSQITALSPRPDFAFFVGDMVARASDNSLGTPGHELLTQWLYFMRHGTGAHPEWSLSTSIPLYVGVGNADLYGSTWWTEETQQQQFRDAFASLNLPTDGPTTPLNYSQLVYSFEYGSGKERSLFVMLDSFGFYSGTTGIDNGYDDEQINWFSSKASASSAPHKFLLTHAPFFSPENWPPDAHYNPASNKYFSQTTKQIWQIAQTNQFDMAYCGHEHIYSRRVIDQSAYPVAYMYQLNQTLAGTSGAPIDSPSSYQATSDTTIHFGYNFTVVDVVGDKVIQHSYAVDANGSGGYTTRPLDACLIKK